MANEGNLKPAAHSLTVEEQSRGGKNSVKSRRRKRDTAGLVNLLLNSKLKGDDIERLKTVSEEVEEDDMTVNALMVAGQIKSPWPETSGHLNVCKVISHELKRMMMPMQITLYRLLILQSIFSKHIVLYTRFLTGKAVCRK